MRARFRLALGLIAACFAVVEIRLAYLQVWRHRELSQRVADQSQRWVREAPRRAPILDRQGALLAESVPVASCYADPSLLSSPETTVRRLAAILSLSPDELARRLGRAEGAFVWVKRRLSPGESQAVEAAGLKGVGLQWEYRRSYANGGLAGSLLGLVGEDGRGLSGLEYEFDEELIDRRPPRLSLRDGQGRRLAMEVSEEAPEGGLRLTIDRALQYIAERELDAALRRSGARGGLVVVQDPWTGDLLALAGRPAFDPSRGGRPTPEELRIPAVQWVFEPGSTFKLVTAAAALEEGRVRPEDFFDCEAGRWRVAGAVIRDHEPQRVISFSRAMEVSSNIGLSKVGLLLGQEKLYDYIRGFGFGTRTGIDVPGEGVGLLRPPREWSGLSLPVLSFGQEIGVTAIQLAAAYSAVANGGVLLEPRLCLDAAWPSGAARSWSSPSAVRRVISPGTAASLARLLRGVVERGTGTAAAVPGWSVAGKTGTAQKTDPATGRYSPTKFVASFCGFAPADRPRFTIVAVLDEPEGPAWGGANAGPVFKNIAWQILSLKGVPPDAPPAFARKGKGSPST
jgi:cell division protein FtsI (penicillin-binding protein 3)